MAKESLEIKIRKALIKQNADDYCGYVAGSRAYNTAVGEMYRELESGLGDYLVMALSNDEEREKLQRKELLELCKKAILVYAHSIYDNLDKLKKRIVKEEEKNYKTILQKNRKSPNFRMLVEYLRSSGADEQKVKRTERAYKDIFDNEANYVKTNNEIVKRLAEIAKNEGMDKAMQKETRYRVIKEFFPTPIEYKLHESRAYNLKNKLMQQIKNILGDDIREDDTVFKKIEHGINALRKYDDLLQTLRRDYTEYMVKEIYPEFSNMPKE